MKITIKELKELIMKETQRFLENVNEGVANVNFDDSGQSDIGQHIPPQKEKSQPSIRVREKVEFLKRRMGEEHFMNAFSKLKSQFKNEEKILDFLIEKMRGWR